MPMDFLSTKRRAFNESCRPNIPVNAQNVEIGSQRGPNQDHKMVVKALNKDFRLMIS